MMLAGARRTTWAAAVRGARALSGSAKGPEHKQAILCILDGWGYNERMQYNAVLQANTPNFDKMWARAGQCGQQAFLQACEENVGLPPGQIGNSEVGHMNLGAGRVVWQDIMTINNAIRDGELSKKKALQDHIAALKESGGTSHVMGLVSPGGVHALDTHVAALANEVNKAGVPVVVHIWTDGRDCGPRDAANDLPKFLESLDEGITIATVTGRFFSMDRDRRWERVGAAYDVIACGKGTADPVDSPEAAIKQAHGQDVGDEFIEATVVGDYQGMKDGDGILCANFRADRAREILTALADPEPPSELGFGSERPERVKLANMTGMVEYSTRHSEFMSNIIEEKEIDLPMGEVIAENGLRQMRIAESEKRPHVTFFFNGGREEPFDNEDRIEIPSPKVKTYDLQPTMGTREIGEAVCEAIEKKDGDKPYYSFVLCNFAAPDMVGHTGSLEAAVTAVETCDEALGKILESVKKSKGTIIVTADHGNCETMVDPETGGPHTAHTLNKVPVFINDYTGEERQYKIHSGALCDVSPTLLEILGIEQPGPMTGKSLIDSTKV
ncbi:2,3-bisphosphoglycerate-independent phosphoglycerate mutase [Hondaea fermentalgiana]|uniref:phosphoglycerate mutase (2,3-diphosphoglycerate-independent) n=1 Tax=Hondaea fermentalgiana TaxID=2315210 RepID=A0A2R5G3R3_9STRA|nr:2,3-bisphosphoglycerate-independent phosphoglycerate mutase [Hondaea fermentalgiana]|eukprot:GBG25676.1 2,3-bisphosphoglycerate-independent phosphoglycerate mutase [Hondaea fermentalgiana]